MNKKECLQNGNAIFRVFNNSNYYCIGNLVEFLSESEISEKNKERRKLCPYLSKNYIILQKPEIAATKEDTLEEDYAIIKKEIGVIEEDQEILIRKGIAAYICNFDHEKLCEEGNPSFKKKVEGQKICGLSEIIKDIECKYVGEEVSCEGKKYLRCKKRSYSRLLTKIYNFFF